MLPNLLKIIIINISALLFQNTQNWKKYQTLLLTGIRELYDRHIGRFAFTDREGLCPTDSETVNFDFHTSIFHGKRPVCPPFSIYSRKSAIPEQETASIFLLISW